LPQVLRIAEQGKNPAGQGCQSPQRLFSRV